MEMLSTALGLALVILRCCLYASANNSLMSVSITRHHKGDVFLAQGTKCYEDLCLGMSSGTASPTDSSGCNCQCMPNLPIFRDDLHICVDDIQECTLAPFLSGTTTQKVPYVFLPLKGQIVYPSAEIIVSDVPTSICVVSGTQFLGRRGWVHLRNNSDTDLPFRLFRDEGRTYLQWLGESDLRLALEGRLILVHLMCKEASSDGAHKIFTPCIAFRVAGNPSAGVREMMFATEKSSRDGEKSLSVSEYIAIGVCILLLGLIYVASLFLYFYFRRKKKQKKKAGDGAHLTVAEEGIVKSNPLLQATRRHLAAVAGQDNGGYASDSGSSCCESDRCSDLALPEDENGNSNQNMEISALVHPCSLECSTTDTLLNQDSNSIERLPEEDVSIVETLEGKEDRPETVRTMGTGNVRKKLYFNPAYFELDMLKAPPPAAIEFLTKIREVIAVAKHKMSAKRFSPSLIGIPEEEYYSRAGKPNSQGNRSRPASVISYAGSTESKRNRKSSCKTCVENEIKESFNIDTGSCCPNDTKQRIIRKWLEDVPFIKSQKDGKNEIEKDANAEEAKPEARKPPPAPPTRKEVKKSNKGPAPPRPPPPPPVALCPNINNIERKHQTEPTQITPKPEITNNQQTEDENIPRVQGKDKVPPVVAKTLMDAVIKELIVQKTEKTSGVQNFIKRTLKSNFDIVNLKNARNEKYHNADKNIFEMDSLERKSEEKEPEKIDSVIKVDDVITKPEEEPEEVKLIDSCIDVYSENVLPVNTDTIDSIIESNEKPQDDHDYEVILLNNTESELEDKEKELKIYNLPEIMSKNDRSEGYSLVSEVYVNDGYSYSSDGSTQSNSSNSVKQNKVRTSSGEKPGRLTIHVKDSPENYKRGPDESETFEPDTLDRKPGKFRYTKTIGNWEDSVQDQYSNQRFHEMDLECQHNVSNGNENFIDSLERPRISLKTSGSFRKNSLEKDVDELFRNLNPPLARHFGSLREIYEAKGRGHRRRTETSSLVSSIPSDVECTSTLSWSEDRRNKLLHRGIILHVADETRRHRRHKHKSCNNYPDVVPPRPPKPSSLTATPNQRSGLSTPATRSYCPSPTSRSACTSPPPRSACTSPRPITLQFPPPPPPRSTERASPCHSGRASPVRSCVSPTILSGRSSPSKAPQPPPRSSCSSPTARSSPCIPPPPKVTSKPTWQKSPCASPVPPPRPPPRQPESSPPLPPRCSKPPLPPKNWKSTRQRKLGENRLARRPLPPIPSPRNYQESTISSVSSRDLETLSVLSGASIDSLNSSDYEAFYTLPYDGQEGEIFDRAMQRTHKIFSTFSPNLDSVSEGSNAQKKSSWKKSRRGGHKLEDSGYLSTDSESGRRHRPVQVVVTSENTGSETEESLCDGASESGAESIATDSFFFGNFSRMKTTSSLDSGVGSDVNKNFMQTFRMVEDEAIPETEGRDVLITVRQ